MKNLLFLCGPNGIGKTTVCKEIMNRLPGSAYVDSDPCRSMNPAVLDGGTIPTVAKNISDLITNYLSCPAVHTVIFSYGFHGRRREVFDLVQRNISHTPHRMIPFLLWCGEEENIRRMRADHRSEDRITRALRESRTAYDDITYPKIDITGYSVPEVAERILRMREYRQIREGFLWIKN